MDPQLPGNERFHKNMKCSIWAVDRNSWTAHPGQVEADYKTQSLQYSPLTLPPVPPHSRQDEARAAAVLGAPPPRRRAALLQPRAPAPPPDLAPAPGPGTEAGTQRPQAGLQETRQIQAPRQVQVRLQYIEDIYRIIDIIDKCWM